ncbi:hypothetical protein D7X74_38310 [Corallococcus sp. CA047B]|uniref:DnaJ domain-containing protein n=1 Tax=Corallococcus sp. CA047B TaxID=2316729 RepID=UPI000EA27650|nr:DnaJ domain-containing protein [Corallococcus sp. CA047B]RKH00802.1 hypothetical protein D7X74_38310 [Corallococcus sp. CA047B]
MSSEPQQNPYAVLGVPRDADARTIKKAYFDLVRQNPPETHPEVFKRLREAYELLSDAEARQAWDATADVPLEGLAAEQAACMAEAVEQFNADNHAAGRRVLNTFLAEHPEAHEVRTLLGKNLLFEGYPPEALVEFDRVLELRPQDWQARLHRGWALQRLERLKEAADDYWRAGKLGPTELVPRVALADCLEQMGQVKDALGVLAEARTLTGLRPMDVLSLTVRRAATMLEHGFNPEAVQELDSLEVDVPANADPELRRWTAGQLSSAAATLFAQQRSEAANKLLERSQRFNPTSATEGVYPVRVDLDVAALSEGARQWLRAEADRHDGGRTLKTWALPAAVSAGLALVTLFFLVDCFRAPETRTVVDWVCRAVFAAGLAAATLYAARVLLRSISSPFGSFHVVHPLHLVQVQRDQLTVWPLVHLNDIQLMDHHDNGRYTHTSLDMRFSRMRLVLRVRGKPQAEALAQELSGRRRRVLELLNRGMLDAESGVEHLPAALLARGAKGRHVHAEGKLPSWVGLGVAAAVAVLVVCASVVPQRSAVDARAWGLALNVRDLGPTLAFLRDRPDSNFAPQAQARLDAELAQARARMETRLDAGSGTAASIPFFSSLLDAVARTHSRRVSVEWLGLEKSDARPDLLVTAWQRMADEALGKDVLFMDSVRAAGREGPPAASLRVRQQVRPLPANGTDEAPVELLWAVTTEGLGSSVASLALTARGVSAEDPAASEALLHAWVERWHLPGTGTRRPLLFTNSLLALEASP